MLGVVEASMNFDEVDVVSCFEINGNGAYSVRSIDAVVASAGAECEPAVVEDHFGCSNTIGEVCGVVSRPLVLNY